MAKAKKLPSGSWHVSAYDYTDEKGKRHYRSFTGPTKRSVESQAAVFQNSKLRLGRSDNLTVAEALDSYISSKEPVLSSSTIYTYRGIQSNYFDSIENRRIYTLTNLDMQRFVDFLVLQDLSPKTVRNIYALLLSSVSMFIPGASYTVHLPKRNPIEYDLPSDIEVARLIRSAKMPLKLAILFGVEGLRRGEICALKYGDFNRVTGLMKIHACMVIKKNGDHGREFVYKPSTKTVYSHRVIEPTEPTVALIGDGDPDDYIIGRNPNEITQEYRRLCSRLGIKCRFHDLRHYYASVMSAFGPRPILCGDGGWKPGSRVLEEVYDNAMDQDRAIFNAEKNKKIKSLMQYEMQHAL